MRNVPVITTGTGNPTEIPLENSKPNSQAPQTGGNAGAQADAGGNATPAESEETDEWRQQSKGWGQDLGPPFWTA